MARFPVRRFATKYINVPTGPKPHKTKGRGQWARKLIGGQPNKDARRRYEHMSKETAIKGVSTRKMANTECGKGRGFSCTRKRGHTGDHYATHPPLTRQNIPGKRR